MTRCEVRSTAPCMSGERADAGASAPLGKCFLKFWQGQAIQHALLRDAALSRLKHAPFEQVQFVGGVRIGVDRHRAPELERSAVPPPIKIEAPWIGVDLDGDVVV